MPLVPFGGSKFGGKDRRNVKSGRMPNRHRGDTNEQYGGEGKGRARPADPGAGVNGGNPRILETGADGWSRGPENQAHGKARKSTKPRSRF